MHRYIAFLKIAEIGSFTKAAEVLGYTQPAISQLIASLEKELSIKLLTRSRYGISLTPEGERLLPSIQSTVSQYQSLMNLADEIRGLDSGVIRIGTISSISCHWLPIVIKKFWEQHPHIQLIVHQGDYTTIPRWVHDGEVDFGFVSSEAVNLIDKDFIKIGEHRACVPQNHPLAKRNEVTLEELSKEPFILLEEGAFSEVLAAFKMQKLEPDIKMTMHDDYSILSMVEKGLGVTILPELVLKKQNYNIKILSIQPMIYRKIGIISRDRNELSVAAKTFINFLKESKDELL